jgi:hypothetical protein
MPLRAGRHLLLHLFQVRRAMCATGRLGKVNTLACIKRPVALAVSAETILIAFLWNYRPVWLGAAVLRAFVWNVPSNSG